MTDASETTRHIPFSRRLMHTRAATRAAMTLERLWPLVLPLLVTVSLFASLSWLGIFRLMPDWLRLGVLGAFAIALIASLYVLRLYRAPRADEVDRRIEAANQLIHTPLLAQTDKLAGTENSFAQALWREHQRRMSERLAGVGGDLPRTGVPERDPWGLRAAVALLLVVAFAFSFGSRGGSLQDAFRKVAFATPVPARIDAWVTPPPYTGKAPIFLTAENNAETRSYTVPEGSEVSLRVTGGNGDETLAFTDLDGAVSDIPLKGAEAEKLPDAPAAGSHASSAPRQFTGTLSQDGVLALRSGEREVQNWGFAVTPDAPPTIRFTGEPKRAANGALELRYEIDDDYGAASAKSNFALEEQPPADAHPLYGAPEMPLSVPRKGQTDAKTNRDLTEHVWAGSRVKLSLSAVDHKGQEGTSEIKTIVMPEHPFQNPLARAVVELRKILSLDANQKPRVMYLIDAITLRPEDTFDNPSHYLGLMAGRTRLDMAKTDDQLREVADYFWNMALQIENGALSDAEKRLRQAQEALKQALRDGASDQEIDRLMKELREAMNQYLKEFAERAMKNPNTAMQAPQQGQELRQSDLERMMDQIENLAKSGNRDQAEQLLSQLQDLMNNLQANRQQQPGENGEQSEMRQQMNKLGEIIRRQQEMMNETFRMDQRQRGQRGQDGEQQFGDMGEQGDPQQGQQGRQGEQGKGMTPEELADAMKQLQEGQGKLKGDLDSLMKGLEGMGIKPGQGFGEAGDAMGQAEGALGEGQGERAVGEQGRALEALRKGAQDMMQQMQQAMQGEDGQGQEGGRQRNADRDPLGRPRATTGPDFGESVKVPEEIDIQRARQILDAIRKRLGNALSPELERDYLERLLRLQ